LNGIQRASTPLPGGDFTVGFHRPWVRSDRPSRARLWIEADGREEAPEGLRDIYLKHLVLDDAVVQPFTDLIA
jgi:hypothetical protein